MKRQIVRPVHEQGLIEVARRILEEQHRAAGQALAAVPGVGSGPSGLTPDAIKFSPAYRVPKAAYDRAHAALRNFNQRHKPVKRSR